MNHADFFTIGKSYKATLYTYDKDGLYYATKRAVVCTEKAGSGVAFFTHFCTKTVKGGIIKTAIETVLHLPPHVACSASTVEVCACGKTLRLLESDGKDGERLQLEYTEV